MTAKDFSFIAGVISNLENTTTRQEACQAFADDLRIVNPRFDERKFMDACKVWKLTIPASRLKVGDLMPGDGDSRVIAISGTLEFDHTAGRMVEYAVITTRDGRTMEFRPSDPVKIYNPSRVEG